MELEKILRKGRNVRNALIGVGLSTAILLGAGGCGTLNAWDLVGYAADSASKDKNRSSGQRESAEQLEQIAKEQARRQHERDIAERSRDETKQEVNVYVENQQREQAPELKTYVFACNYFKDLNNDNLMTYPDEFIGIKNKFRNYERILLVAYDEKSRRGQVAKGILFNPLGVAISGDEFTYQTDGSVLYKSVSPTWLAQMGGYGNYKYVYYLNGKYVDSTEFEIVKE